MRFLIDAPLAPETANWLTAQGHDAIHVMNLGMLKASDEAILIRAAQERRLVITMDLDFPQIMAVQERSRPGIILIRLSYATPERIHGQLATLFQSVDSKALAGAVTVVEDARFRIRKLPIRYTPRRQKL